jgi:hypothetical protein
LTTDNVPDLNYLLEGPESAPVLVFSNSLGMVLEMWDGQAPTLQDPATQPEHGGLIRDSIHGARFEVVPGAAHIANVEQPETITRLILDHLEAR